MRCKMKKKWGDETRDRKKMGRQDAREKIGETRDEKKWGDETRDKKQNWETRREMGKKWGDGTQDKKNGR